MKLKMLAKRLLSALLLVCMLLGMMPVSSVSAAESWDVDGDGTLSILCIGNSFSVDAMQYIYQIAQNLGITKIYLGNIYKGGCTLATHYDYASNDTAGYTYYYNSSGTWKSASSYKMSTALTSRSWDYVSMQQASPNSGQESTYNSNLTNLVSYVKGKLKSSATKLVWHMTWAYQENSTHSGFANYNNNQTTMYNSIVSAVQSKIKTNSNFEIVVPNGTAIQNARTSLIKDNLTRDGYHLNKNVGRYIAGLTFLHALGIDISGVTYQPGNVPDGYKAIAIESATNAVATPYSVTTSAHTDVTTSEYYTQRTLSLKFNSYWNSASASNYNVQYTPSSSHSNYYKFYSTQRFNQYTLPVGSVIVLSGSTWQYRPDAWLTNTQQTSRPDTTTAAYTVCSDEWWANDEGTTYLYRAFNISFRNGSYFGANDWASDIKAAFKIYVPKEYTTSDLSPDTLYSNISTLLDPIPNNYRVTWGAESEISAIKDVKYILVYGPSTSSSVPASTYAWDPTTPRLFGTFHAAPVTVSSKSGDERVYGADTSWGITLTYNYEFDYTQAGYSAQPNNQFMAAFTVKLPTQNITSTDENNVGQYLTNVVKYSSSTGYASGLGNTWRLYNSDYYSGLTGATNTSVAWAKRNARAHLYFNWEKDRMSFFFWPQYRTDPVAIGDKTSRTSVRSIFTNPSTEDPYFSLGTTELGNSDSYATFYLFAVDTAKANTEKLYDKLKEAQKYINVDYTYFTTEYNTFLDALNNAYSVYNSCNGYDSSQTDVNIALNTLTNAITNLNAYNQIEFMSIPYTKRISVTDAQCSGGLLEGTYFISRYYTGNMDYVHSFIDKNTIVGGDFGIQRYLVTSTFSYGVQANDLSDAITLRAVENNSYAYTLQFEDSNFISNSGATLSIGNPTSFKVKPSEYESGGFTGGISIFNSDSTYVLYCDAATTYDWSLESASSTNVASYRANFHLFQCSPTTLELYRALQFIQPYCDQDEAIKRYPSALYKEFLADIKEAMTAYTTYNTSGYFSNAIQKATLEEMAANIRAWADTLTQADMTLSYIDIPVEVLDFKADGVLFEYDDGYYGLVSDGSVATTLPGSLWTDANGGQCRIGLTEAKLVDGNLVYKEQTITNIAQKILADDTVRGTYSAVLDADGADYNKEFFYKIGTITTLGTYADTLKKTSTGKNGGDLDWNEVVTAFDMAYYVLTYLWREVPQTDANKLTLSDDDTYNMKVPEREVLRLYKEETSGLYTFYSEDNMAYNGYYMYNTIPTIDNPQIGNYADFTPVNGIGFEANGVETDASGYYAAQGYVDKYETDNYHYVVHAYGSFVYYEDQDLYFEFIGDDDVYFYINNEIAMDIGGAHAAVGNTLNLSDFTMADGSKLVDGEIYTFDMYYAERHTHAANMKFNTNIKIVDTDTLTTKGQYVEISGDADMVDSKTGMGTEMIDNGVVKVGDTVAYSFEVVNSHDVAVYDLIFQDETLGTYLSKNIIALTNEEMTFTTTDITDIEVYYRTSVKDSNDNITVNSDIPVVKTLAEIKEMINTANTATETTPGTSLPEGSYRVTMTSEQDLMDLMALGVPANCQIVIYGFKRLMVEDDENTTITNNLTMTCSYLPWGSNDTELDVRSLSGTASRILKVAALSGIPNATRADVVIDYGKPLSIDVNGTISQASGVTNNGFVGFTASGYNGEFLKYAPSDLTDVFYTDSGTFTYRLGSVYYSLTDMISQVEKVYAVFSLTGCEFADVTGKAREYPYVLAEIRIIPATAVYYETDFDQIDFVGNSTAYYFNDFASSDTSAWTNATNMTGTKADGVLKGSISGTDPHIQMDLTNGGSLSHTVTADDVVKLRMKTDVGTGTNVQVFFVTDQNTSYTGGISTDFGDYTPSGEYQILTIPIYSAVVGRTITGIRIDPISSYTAAGDYEIDWVYIGPDVAASSLFAYTEDDSTVFATTTTDTTNPWQTDGTSETTLQTTTYANEEDSYGYDLSYADDATHSNGGSLFVIGAGVPKFNTDYSVNYDGSEAYTEVSFTFTGTGIDIISRTGSAQGALRVMVYDAQGNKEEAITVMNKGNSELYQIPVVSIDDLSYGEHTVKIFVNASYENTSLPALNRGGEFYFDAVRIYNPIDTASDDFAYAYSVYQKYGEADPVYTEVRNILIDAGNLDAGATMNGVVYLDATANEDTEFDDEDGRLELEVAEYKAIGPNNEVYLAAGTAIAFKLVAIGEIPASVDIGAKSADGTSVSVIMDVSSTAPSAATGATTVLASCTPQNYPLSIESSDWITGDGEYYTYVIISNSGTSGILSITDIKHAYNTAATALVEETETTESLTTDRVTKATSVAERTVRYVVDSEMLEAFGVCYDHTYSYTNNGEDHTVTCENCNYSETAEHTYTDGSCICGAVEVIEPKYEPEENLKFTMSISAGAEMTVTYSIMGTAVNSYKDFYLEVTKDVANGDPITTVYGITEDREAMTVKSNPTTGEAIMYQVTYSGINAKEMGDNFSTTLYAVGEDGTIYCGETVVDSIKSFLVGKIDAEASIPELKTMAVDMLKYGAAAQVRLGYNTENLVIADLTEEQLAYATQEIPEAVDHATATGEGANVSTNITVTSRVQLNLSCIYTTATAPETIKCVITDAEGKVLSEIAATNKNNVMFSAIYENVGAKEMRDVINATFYEGETAISKTVSWSVESYVAQVRAKTNATEDELNMVNAMLTYGDAVAAYMEAK